MWQRPQNTVPAITPLKSYITPSPALIKDMPTTEAHTSTLCDQVYFIYISNCLNFDRWTSVHFLLSPLCFILCSQHIILRRYPEGWANGQRGQRLRPASGLFHKNPASRVMLSLCSQPLRSARLLLCPDVLRSSHICGQCDLKSQAQTHIWFRLAVGLQSFVSLWPSPSETVTSDIQCVHYYI